MRRYFAVGLLAAVAASGASAAETGCSRYGTQVEFVDSPREAARQAREQEKLVFVLHVSGHFENPAFT